MANQKILLTGATGNIGSELSRRLTKHNNVTLRVFVRDTAKVADLISAGAESVEGTLEEPEALRTALEGIDTVVLITPFSPSAVDQTHSIITKVKKAFVRRIVPLSVIKASPNGPSDSYRQHGRTDAEI